MTELDKNFENIIIDKSSNDEYFNYLRKIPDEGVAILIDKPAHWTSFDVIAKLRNIINFRKIGHCGTLDPLATGLMILAIGKMTKKIHLFQDLDKVYSGSIKIGCTTKTYDSEGDEENHKDISMVTEEDILNRTKNFIGEISQKPPIYSAIKVGGQRLYKLARKGESIEIPIRKVKVFRFEITKIELPEIQFVIECSKGTYIRSIANDFGQELGTGAYLNSLRREKIGSYDVANALTLEDIIKIKQSLTLDDE